jgi:hypothetical protein
MRRAFSWAFHHLRAGRCWRCRPTHLILMVAGRSTRETCFIMYDRDTTTWDHRTRKLPPHPTFCTSFGAGPGGDGRVLYCTGRSLVQSAQFFACAEANLKLASLPNSATLSDHGLRCLSQVSIFCKGESTLTSNRCCCQLSDRLDSRPKDTRS